MAGSFRVQYPTLYNIISVLPATGSTGQLVFLTTDNSLYIWYDGAWHAVGGSSINGARITQPGDYRVTQNGSNRVIQSA